MTVAKELEQSIKTLRNSGHTQAEICKKLKCSKGTIVKVLNPELHAKQREIARIREREKRIDLMGGYQSPVTRDYTSKSIKADLEKRLAEIPQDTRSKTGRAFGDPIFERSALYQRHLEAVHA